MYICPACKSQNCYAESNLGIAFWIMVIMFSCVSMGLALPVGLIIYALAPTKKKCRACGNQW